MLEIQALAERYGRQLFPDPEMLEQQFYWVVYWVAGRKDFERVADRGQHEFHEGGGLRQPVGGSECRVVFRLPLADQALHRQPSQFLVPRGQSERLPEPAHPAVSVGEGVDQLDLVVKHRTRNQRMVIGFSRLSEEIPDQMLDPVGGRCHVNQLATAVNADPAVPEDSGMVDQRPHHDAMSGEGILNRSGLPIVEAVVALDGIAHFLDFMRRSQDALALEDGGDLIETSLPHF